MAREVFISYCSDDGPSAVAACAALETQGISCWMAPRDIPPGARYPAAIAEAISGARVLVLIYSSSCNTSPHIERELERATSRGILVVPVRLDKAALSPSLEYLLSTPQWVDASEARLEMHLGRLVEAVKEQLVHVPLAKRPGPKAPRARRWRITAGIAFGVGVALLLILSVLRGRARWSWSTTMYRQMFSDARLIEPFWKLPADRAPWSSDASSGTYCLTNFEDVRATTFIHVHFERTDLVNAPVSTKVSVEGPRQFSQAGLLYRHSTAADGSPSYYAFVISSTGRWAFYKRTKSLDVDEPLVSGGIPGSEVAPTLGIVADGPHFRLYIDERQVARFDDYELATGAVGIVAMSTGKFCFDDFTIYKR